MRRALVLAAVLAAPFVPPLLAAPPARSPGAGSPHKEDLVRIDTSDGLSLQASYQKPPATHAPAVILVHAAGSNRAQLEVFADRLNKQGFGVLSLDLRGHGGSKSDKLDWDKLSDSDKKSTWAAAPRDIDAAAEWIREQPDIQGTNLSLLAVGSGCALAVRHAKGDENVCSMALLAPNAEDYGLDVRADIQALVGLPTFVVTAKDGAAERMALEANASSSNPYVELFISQTKLASPLDDKKLPAKIASWLGDKAMPKKGK